MNRVQHVLIDVAFMLLGGALIGVGAHSVKIGLGSCMLVMGSALWLKDVETKR